MNRKAVKRKNGKAMLNIRVEQCLDLETLCLALESLKSKTKEEFINDLRVSLKFNGCDYYNDCQFYDRHTYETQLEHSVIENMDKIKRWFL